MRTQSGNRRTGLVLWPLTAVSVVLGMHAYRVLLPGFRFYLQDTAGISSLRLVPIALIVFSLGLLAYPLHRRAGDRRALVFAVAGLAAVRIVLQISRDSALSLVFSALGVTLFAVYLIYVISLANYSQVGPRVAVGLLLGISADTALLTATGTLDLVWQSGWGAWVGVSILVLLALLALFRALLTGVPDDRIRNTMTAPWRLMAIGPWLFLQMLMFQNVARLAALSGWALPWAGLWVWGVNVVSLAIVVIVIRARRWNWAAGLAAGIFFVLAVVPNEASGLLGVALTTLGHILSFVLLAGIFLVRSGTSSRRGILLPTLFSVLGQELLVVVTFLYYASQDLALGFRAPAVPPVAAALVALIVWAASGRGASATAAVPRFAAVGLGLVLVILPLALLLTWRPTEPQAAADQQGLRVMTYNLHQGFNTAGWLDIESQAEVIARADADVVVLQEVSRGYVINGSLDLLSWLSQRLEMPFVWAPTADPLWGNAVLSRLPIARSQAAALPPEDLLVRRGYIDSAYDVDGSQLRLIATHLHHRSADSDVRVQQVEALLLAWGNTPKTIILGDLNALPESPEMQLLAQAGLVDVLSMIEPPGNFTFYSADPSRQIDYIWITRDLIPDRPRVIRTTASDHLPIFVQIR